MSVAHTIVAWGRMVKVSHSVFALPFALSGAALAAAESGIGTSQILWIIIATLAARGAAMGYNRLADHALDARNPRTAERELPARRLTRRAVWVFTLGLAALFVFAAFRLGRLCGLLSPLALAIVFGYSYTKRFTWASHLTLGLALAVAPVGGWLAVRGEFAALPWLLAAAVLLWVAGFDVVYACQDLEFDRREGLYSIPARFGLRGALLVARGLHGGALAALAAVGWLGQLHPVYWVGCSIIGAILVLEHRWVRTQDLTRLGPAFFNMNGAIAVIYLVTILAAVTAA
jgi:4-hydroxybenzoate polyprenyltransferase